jgi:NADH-quinone oxidoreductase subunit A
MLNNYIPILFFIGIGIAIGALPILLGKILAPNKPNKEKLTPYECGFDAFEDARKRFDIRFYLVSILFIIFDLEVAFLLPWATVIDQINWLGFGSMLFFLLLLVVGFVYEWQKGALEWE